MKKHGFREEVTNTLVSQVLEKLLGMEVRPEAKGRPDGRLVDIYIPGKHRVVIEAKYNNFGDAVIAAQKRWGTVKPRPDIVGALSYSPLFEKNPEQAIRNEETIEYALSGSSDIDMHEIKRTGTIYDLAQALRRPAAILHPGEDEIEEAVKCIQDALTAFYEVFKTDFGILHEFADILQASFDRGETEEDEKKNRQETLEQSAKVAGLILFGAFLFQFALSRKHRRVKAPSVASLPELSEHWRMILEEINYASIFDVAKRVLDAGVLKKPAEELLNAARHVQDLAEDGTDLMGRIYHRLLADAKPLGAFYTSIPAATLIAGLSLSPEDWGETKQWADIDFIRKLRICDLACGSGTLLAAACWQIRDNFARANFKERDILTEWNPSRSMNDLHKVFLEDVIWGYDILETAGHLTSTTLGLMSPDVDFRKAHIYRTIIGKVINGTATGSLEMLEGRFPVFRRKENVEAAAERRRIELKKSRRARRAGKEAKSIVHSDPLPELDLCIMNPPFVRGSTQSPSYSFLDETDQIEVHERMNQLGRKHGYSNDKGLGPAFIALACNRYIKTSVVKEGGRLAVILPVTFTTGMGSAWKKTRAKIEKDFDLEMLIVSRDSGRPNFSEDTALSECIAIARKRKKHSKPKKHALFVVLHKNPTNSEEALAIVQAVNAVRKSRSKLGDLPVGDSQKSLLGSEIGRFAKLPYYNRDAWRGTSFSDIRLAFVAENFAQTGDLTPYVKGKPADLCVLGNVATFGKHVLHHRQNQDKMEIVNYETNYATYYPGLHKRMTGVAHRDIATIAEDPHFYVLPKPSEEKWIEEFYKTAGHILLNFSFRFNTARRLSTLVSKPVQASHYCPINLRRDSIKKRKALTLWLNSTPALLLIVNAVQSTDGSKVGLSLGAVSGLRVLNLDALSAGNLKKLAEVFDEVSRGELLHLPDMTHDLVRKRIDDAISDVCGFEDLLPLREALAVEPIITNVNNPINRGDLTYKEFKQ